MQGFYKNLREIKAKYKKSHHLLKIKEYNTPVEAKIFLFKYLVSP